MPAAKHPPSQPRGAFVGRSLTRRSPVRSGANREEPPNERRVTKCSVRCCIPLQPRRGRWRRGGREPGAPTLYESGAEPGPVESRNPGEEGDPCRRQRPLRTRLQRPASEVDPRRRPERQPRAAFFPGLGKRVAGPPVPHGCLEPSRLSRRPVFVLESESESAHSVPSLMGWDRTALGF